MKKKSFITLATGAFALAALVGAGILVLGNSNLSSLGIARATPTSSGSFTLTADDFANESGGSIVKNGEIIRYGYATKSNGVVRLSSTLYTDACSGASKKDERRGDGYTRVVFENLDLSDAVGQVFHLKDVNKSITKAANAFNSSDIDLTFGGTVASKDRRGIEFVQAGGSIYSFTSVTFYYDCADVTPTIEIQESGVQIGVGNQFELTTKMEDVFSGVDITTITWESDDTDVLTVAPGSPNTKATITGKSAGKANITVNMEVSSGKSAQDTIEVTVTATPATVHEVEFKSSSYVEGAGIFANFDTTSLGMTAAQVTAFTPQITFDGLTQNMSSNTVRDVVDNTFQCYTIMDGASGMNGQFSVTYDFKDNANNIIYRAAAHFDVGKYAPAVVLSASGFSVETSSTLEVTASKGFYLEGTPSAFVFESLDTSKFTVSANGAVATITGVAEGSADLRVTMTLGGENYVVEKTIAVTTPGVQHLIPWYTDGVAPSNQRNHWDGAGVWLWVKYGDLDYDGFGSFSAQKANMTVSCDKTGIRVEVISDDVAASKYCRVYLVADSEQHNSKITMTIPDAHGITYTGSITFVNGEATAYNS